MSLVTESYLVPSDDEVRLKADTTGGADTTSGSIQLYVRNTRPDTLTTFSPERTLLFVHGATYPSDTMFGLKIDGESWMDFIARHGYDVYSMDVRGFGRSTRPPEMNVPARDNPPVVNTDDGVRDFGAVVDHIRQRRGIPRLNLMGWSWGTVIAGAYASSHPDAVERLVMYAPLWLRKTPGGLRVDGEMGAYRTVTAEAARRRWLNGVAANRQQDLIPPGVFEAWWTANMEADPIGASMTPPGVRAPNGLLAEAPKYWEGGTRYYDPSGIRAPVLLVVGDWDVDTPAYMAQAILGSLGSREKRLVIIGEGTHHLMLERNRVQMFRKVQSFLNHEGHEGHKEGHT